MTGALHRLGQFWRHASASVAGNERMEAERILGPELSPLFLELSRNDQRHGLDVLETLRRIDQSAGPLLQQAALLHDAGKSGAHFSVMERSLSVLLKAVWPSLLAGLARVRPSFGERLQIYEDHARIGADRLHALGAGELAQIVLEHHAARPALELTRRLQQADRRN